MRLFALLAALSLSVAACGQAPASVRPTVVSPSSTSLKPARIERVRTELPTGYEVAGLSGRVSPAAFWGLRSDWAADPPRCGALADPAADAATTRGWSASGAGGIVYAVVAISKATLDPALLDECGQWAAAARHTHTSVTLVTAPTIDAAAAVGVSATTTTVVEGGTETYSHADTFTAYLGDYVAFVTVVSDPGSPNPPLGPDFAAKLLVKTVSVVRG